MLNNAVAGSAAKWAAAATRTEAIKDHYNVNFGCAAITECKLLDGVIGGELDVSTIDYMSYDASTYTITWKLDVVEGYN